MTSQFALGSSAVTNQDLNQAKSTNALRVLKGQDADAGKIDKAAKDLP